jgi:hypothetical protein
MAHTMFSASPFRPGGYGQAVAPLSAPQMGNLFDDALDALGLSDLLDELDKLINSLPVGALRSEYEKERARCMAMSSPSKQKCLYDLAQKVRKNEPLTTAKPPPPATPTKPEGDSFPWIPVGIGAGVVVAAVLYSVLSKK